MPELPTGAAWLLTMLAFVISLCFFRARSPGKAIDMMVDSVSGSWIGFDTFIVQNIFPILLVVLFAATHHLDDHRLVKLAIRRARPELVWAAILFAWIAAITVSQGSSGAFVYFDF
jgi:hypothetical protein